MLKRVAKNFNDHSNEGQMLHGLRMQMSNFHCCTHLTRPLRVACCAGCSGRWRKGKQTVKGGELIVMVYICQTRFAVIKGRLA